MKKKDYKYSVYYILHANIMRTVIKGNWDHFDNGYLSSCMPIHEISELLNISTYKVRTALALLEEVGWIVIDKRAHAGTFNVYILGEHTISVDEETGKPIYIEKFYKENCKNEKKEK